MKVDLSSYLVGYWSPVTRGEWKTKFGDYEYVSGLDGQLWYSIEKQHSGKMHKIKMPGRGRAAFKLLEDAYND